MGKRKTKKQRQQQKRKRRRLKAQQKQRQVEPMEERESLESLEHQERMERAKRQLALATASRQQPRATVRGIGLSSRSSSSSSSLRYSLSDVATQDPQSRQAFINLVIFTLLMFTLPVIIFFFVQSQYIQVTFFGWEKLSLTSSSILMQSGVSAVITVNLVIIAFVYTAFRE
mmetsp:Transcript_9169/g.13868  ORF Transcript_9169/g.13868 Transcript_9169/m.13868 type:complete len:172 (-) Transcript_9169:169-684(-)